MKIGTKVKFRIPQTLSTPAGPYVTGKIVGGTMIQSGVYTGPELHTVVMIELDEGFYAPNKAFYVSIIPINVELVEKID